MPFYGNPYQGLKKAKRLSVDQVIYQLLNLLGTNDSRHEAVNNELLKNLVACVSIRNWFLIGKLKLAWGCGESSTHSICLYNVGYRKYV